MMRVKRDIIFVLVMAIIVANLAFLLITTLLGIVNAGLWTDLRRWGLVFADAVAIYGALWLVRSYRRGRRANKMKEKGK
jgi:type VI protein secretion system component VasK